MIQDSCKHELRADCKINVYSYSCHHLSTEEWNNTADWTISSSRLCQLSSWRNGSILSKCVVIYSWYWYIRPYFVALNWKSLNHASEGYIQLLLHMFLSAQLHNYLSLHKHCVHAQGGVWSVCITNCSFGINNWCPRKKVCRFGIPGWRQH